MRYSNLPIIANLAALHTLGVTMLIESQSDLISSHSHCYKNQQYLELLTMKDQKVLALSCNSLALYKNQTAVTDALGQGLLSFCKIPESHHLPEASTPWVSHYRAGFVALNNDYCLLITPLAIQLFTDKTYALHNKNEVCRLDLQGVYDWAYLLFCLWLEYVG